MGEGHNKGSELHARMHEHIFMHSLILHQMRHFPFREVTEDTEKHHSPLIEGLFLAELLG